MRKRWASVLAILLISLSVAGIILYPRYIDEKVKLQYQWPTTTDTVLSYYELWSPDREVSASRRIFVDYTYEINGRKYSAQQTWIFTKGVPKYSQGQIVTVYYNSPKPERSAIEPWVPPFGMQIGGSCILYGGILAFMCAFAIVWSNRKKPW